MSYRVVLRTAAGILSGLGGFLPIAAAAQEALARPRVQVEFRVEAIRYVQHFLNNRSDLEQQAAKRFAKSFEDQFGFLDFTSAVQPVKLKVVLANVSTSQACTVGDPNCPKETILRLALEQSDLPASNYNDWVYLKRDDFFVALGGVDEEVENLVRVGFQKLNVPDVIAKLLSRIQLTPTGHLLWKPAGGTPGAKEQIAGVAVPLPAIVLCADQHSVLVLRSEIPQEFVASAKAEVAIDALGPFVPPENSSDDAWKNERGNLFGIPAVNPPTDRKWDAWDSLMAVSDKNQIKVTGIFMHQYRRMDTGCSPAILPNAAQLGGSGGGQ
jgi:hypothetical protein